MLAAEVGAAFNIMAVHFVNDLLKVLVITVQVGLWHGSCTAHELAWQEFFVGATTDATYVQAHIQTAQASNAYIVGHTVSYAKQTMTVVTGPFDFQLDLTCCLDTLQSVVGDVGEAHEAMRVLLEHEEGTRVNHVLSVWSQVMYEAADGAMRALLEHCRPHQLLKQLTTPLISDRSVKLRHCCATYLLQVRRT